MLVTVQGTAASKGHVQLPTGLSGREEMNMRRNIVWTALVALALSACGGAGTAETFYEIGGDLDGGQGANGTENESETREKAPFETINLDLAVTSDRKVIRNVSLQLEANETRSTYEQIVTIAEANGGFVAFAEVSPAEDEEEPVIQLTVRIPSSNLTPALTAIKGAADEVISESQGAQDVTEQFIDLEAQLTNLTLLETVLEEVRQQPEADPTKLLQVFTEISNTRGEIERIQGQLNYLGDAVELATVSIGIAPTPQSVPIVAEGWAPSDTVRDAARDLVAGLQNLADVVITFGIAVLPMLVLVLGIPGLALYVAYRSWRSRRKAAGPAPLPAE